MTILATGERQAATRWILDQSKAEEIAAKDWSDQLGTIIEVKTEGKSDLPPLAYDLTELQRDANRRWVGQRRKLWISCRFCMSGTNWSLIRGP